MAISKTTNKKSKRNSLKRKTTSVSAFNIFNKRKKKRKSSGTRRKKPKFVVPLNQVVVLFLVIVVACTALILINSFSSDFSSDANSDIYESSGSLNEKSKQSAGKEKYVSKNAEKSGFSQKNKSLSLKQNVDVSSFQEKKSEVLEKSGNVELNSAKKQKKNLSSAEKLANEIDAYKKTSEKKRKEEKAKENNKSSIYLSPDVPFIPAATKNARLVFVFDDGGQNISHLEKILSLPFPVTVAVMPKLQFSVESAEKVRSSGNELMLHQPMQALNLNVNPGKGAITPDMSLDEIEFVLKDNLKEIGPVSGINNHEGSLITEDEIRMTRILSVADKMNVFFLDSRTTSQTRVPQAAMSLGLSYYERNIFLDNVLDRKSILNEIVKGLEIANKKGCVIMIGHVWSADILPSILEELYPLLKQKGYNFSTVSKSGALISL